MDSIKQFLEKDTPEVYRLYDRILEGIGDLNDLIKDVRDRALRKPAVLCDRIVVPYYSESLKNEYAVARVKITMVFSSK